MKVEQPILVVVMGVSGCGKSTLASEIAKQLGLLFLEADDFHSPQAKALMAKGIALDDSLRQPWVESICEMLTSLAASRESVVLAFSGLRRQHRDRLRQLPFRCVFLWLDVPFANLEQRLAKRQGHFFAPELLASQFQALQQPDLKQEKDVLPVQPHEFANVQSLVQASQKLITGEVYV